MSAAASGLYRRTVAFIIEDSHCFHRIPIMFSMFVISCSLLSPNHHLANLTASARGCRVYLFLLWVTSAAIAVRAQRVVGRDTSCSKRSPHRQGCEDPTRRALGIHPVL